MKIAHEQRLGTRLTGKHLRYELFPFSYFEFLNFASKSKGQILLVNTC